MFHKFHRGNIHQFTIMSVFHSRESVLFSSVTQLCPTLWDPIDCSMPGLPVHHQLLEFTQTHVHWLSDAIQPSHPLSSPSPSALNLSQHQGHFKWVSCSHQVAKVLEFLLQHQSFQWTPLGWTCWISLHSKGLSRVFSNHHSWKASILWHSAFFILQLSHLYMTTGKTIALTRQTLLTKWCLCFLICCLGWSKHSFQGVSVF